MHKKFSVVMVLVAMSILVGCNGSDSSKKDGQVSGAGNGEEFYGSYEVEAGCTSGRHLFSESTEEETATAFCNGLKDETLNNSCAPLLRERIFARVQCAGAFPDSNTAGSSYSLYSDSYKFGNESCATGFHNFGSSTEKGLKVLYCKALKDEFLNHNCAKDQRVQKYQEIGCGNILK